MALIVPSLLAFDFARLRDELELIRQAGIQTVHIDVCDGHFAPGLTVGQPVVESVARAGGLKLEVHLLVERPERLVEDFARAGASRIAIHPESTPRFLPVLGEIRARGCQPGVVLNPAMTVEVIRPVLAELDFLIVLFGNQGSLPTPQPAYSGVRDNAARRNQAAAGLANTIDRLRAAAEERVRSGCRFAIEVEGPIDPEWVPQLEEAGADVLVMSAVTDEHPDPGSLLGELVRRVSNTSGVSAI
jgi:ribulose-phosphate 3-epimerase